MSAEDLEAERAAEQDAVDTGELLTTDREFTTPITRADVLDPVLSRASDGGRRGRESRATGAGIQ